MLSLQDMTVVLVHGAWADGSSWSEVIGPLTNLGLRVAAVPLPLSSLSDDGAALRRTLSRTEGPVIVAGHAYAGAVIATATEERVRGLVYIAALAPAQGETVAQLFYPTRTTRWHLNWRPIGMAGSGCPTQDSPMLLRSMQRQIRLPSPGQYSGRSLSVASRNQRPSPPGTASLRGF